MSSTDAYRGAVPPTPTHLAAQRLLVWCGREEPNGCPWTCPGTADVRLVAEAVVARSAENAETCACHDALSALVVDWLDKTHKYDRWRSLSEYLDRRGVPMVGMKNPGEELAESREAVSDLARREAALQAEVVRLREALEGEAAQRLRALAEPEVLQAWSSREFEGKWWVSEAHIEVAADRLRGLAHAALDLLGDVGAALKEDA